MARGSGGEEGGRTPRRPYRWTDEILRAELEVFTRDHATFPSRRHFEGAGRLDLWDAIKVRGGVRRWAMAIGMPLLASQEPGLSEDEAVAQAREVIALL